MGDKRIPARLCVGCRVLKPKNELLRVARLAEGDYRPDKEGTLPGRGAYLCPSPECLRKAQKARGLERSFKAKIPAEIYAELAAYIEGKEDGHGD
ncbi:MAG: YlxR family protein [Selenomonadaceae bacterium]|nr:YlxR family protein [Selenomonadaceae bacterium]